jgi:CubicO group peptidase (beta-lactamase class C family)
MGMRTNTKKGFEMRRHTAICVILGLIAPLLMVDMASAAGFDLEKSKVVLERLIEQELAKGVASVSIALVRDDEIVWTAAYGYANYRMKTPATPETIYVTGSTFKAVTATAILQLVEQGKCKLDDPVNKFLGDAQIDDDEENPVTFRHILSHTSGLTPGARTVAVWSRTLPASLEEFTAGLSSIRPVEEKYEYNNFAYGMAGLLVEKISGMSYEDYVVKNILKPLGVKTRHPVEPDARMVERMALPYVTTSSEKPHPVRQTRFDVFPAGDIYLTAEDMARFLAAHLNEGKFQGARILDKKSAREAHRKQFFDYGLGWQISESEDGHAIIEHGGSVSGFITYMAGDLDAKVGAYVMSNSNNMRAIAMAALTLLRGEPYIFSEDREEITLDPGKIDELPGEYELNPQFKLTVTNENGLLFVQATGQGKLALHAESESKFFVKEVDAQFTFGRNSDGVVDSLTLHQNGQNQKGIRVSE